MVNDYIYDVLTFAVTHGVKDIKFVLGEPTVIHLDKLQILNGGKGDEVKACLLNGANLVDVDNNTQFGFKAYSIPLSDDPEDIYNRVVFELKIKADKFIYLKEVKANG